MTFVPQFTIEKKGDDVNVAKTYLAKAREDELSVYVLIDFIDVRGELCQINTEVTQRMCY